LCIVTVLEAIKLSTDFLSKKGVDSPRLQAELLLGKVLQIPRMRLYLDFEKTLSETETASLRELVKRRSQREPLQHILGTANFCGLEIEVNRHVLVPRPETELLAEAGWAFLNSISAQGTSPRALDICSGSGCIALVVAQKCPATEVWASDISPEAVEVAVRNSEKSGLASRVHFVVSDLFSAVPPELRFNLIISNPPYIPSEEIAGLEAEVRDYDPRGALDGGSDGLGFYRRLAAESLSRLESAGKLMVEFGDCQATAIQKIFEQQNWIVEAIREDYTRRPRFMVLRSA
jgi:release factor glutamine methyltransferase